MIDKSKKIKLLSPLRYPGGKAKILDFLIKVIEENEYYDSEYLEPYAGGAGVALGLLISGAVSHIHINDIDPGIYSFWNVILNNTDRFIDKIEETKITVKEWEKQRNIYHNLIEHSEFERAFSVFFLNRCNRSGIITAGIIGGKNQDGAYKIDARFNKAALINRIKRIAKYKDKISVYNKDTNDLLSNYNNMFNKKTISYLDPPYYIKGQDLYRNFYTHSDHLSIANKLKNMEEFWIVSYDNVPEINSFYSRFNKKEFNICYHAGRKKTGKEVMFFSDIVKVPPIPVY